LRTPPKTGRVRRRTGNAIGKRNSRLQEPQSAEVVEVH